MSALRGLALNAFLSRRHERARRLFEVARSRADAVGGGGSAWPDHVHRILAGILDDALAGDCTPGSQGLLTSIEQVGDLLRQLPVAAVQRDHATRRLVERVGFELARLAGRSDLMQQFGPPMTVAEATWAIQGDPDFLAERPGEASDELPDDTEPVSEKAPVTVAHLVAAAQLRGPTMRFSYPPYVFAGLDQQARVRFSSPQLFQAFDARLAHTGRQTTERTSFTLRPAGLADDAVERVVDEIGGQRPVVRFEFTSHDEGIAQVAAFREVVVGRSADGIELILDYRHKTFLTEQLPEDVWRALASCSPVTVAIVL